MEGRTLAITVVFSGLVAMAVGMGILYGGGPPQAPERPGPPPPESLMNAVRYSEPMYKALLEQDARTYEIPAPAPKDLTPPNPYFEEWKGRRRLKPRSSVETEHLKITLSVDKLEASVGSNSYNFDHLVLKIENKTPLFLAYRIETEVGDPRKCVAKGNVDHNAIVLQPGETIVRTECLYRSDQALDLTHVEVIELPTLSAFYVSRLPPALILYDTRTSAGHTPLKGRLCPQTFSWREIKEGAERKELGWRDVIDFYARHNCDEYSFFRSYRYRKDAAGGLPVRPPESG